MLSREIRTRASIVRKVHLEPGQRLREDLQPGLLKHFAHEAVEHHIIDLEHTSWRLLRAAVLSAPPRILRCRSTTPAPLTEVHGVVVKVSSPP